MFLYHPKFYNSHIEMCQNLEQACKIDFPKSDYLYFKSFQTKIDIPIRVYADFECFNIPIDEYISDKTKILFTHEPCSVVYYLKSPWQTGYKTFSGKMCVNSFVNDIFEIEKLAGLYYNTNLKLEMTPENELDFQNSKHCHLCDKPFLKCKKNIEYYEDEEYDEEYDEEENCKQNNCECKKVRDHDHLTGLYRGAAHNVCNLKAKQIKSSFVPVFFHNFSGYDCHLIFEQLINKAIEIGFDKNDIKIIPKSIENFISLKIGRLRFLDSYRFLPSSLDSLSKSLNDFPILRGQGLDDPMLLKKLAFPYEYFNRV